MCSAGPAEPARAPTACADLDARGACDALEDALGASGAGGAARARFVAAELSVRGFPLRLDARRPQPRVCALAVGWLAARARLFSHAAAVARRDVEDSIGALSPPYAEDIRADCTATAAADERRQRAQSVTSAEELCANPAARVVLQGRMRRVIARLATLHESMGRQLASIEGAQRRLADAVVGAGALAPGDGRAPDRQAERLLTAHELHLLAHPRQLQAHVEALQQSLSLVDEAVAIDNDAEAFAAWLEGVAEAHHADMRRARASHTAAAERAKLEGRRSAEGGVGELASHAGEAALVAAARAHAQAELDGKSTYAALRAAAEGARAHARDALEALCAAASSAAAAEGVRGGAAEDPASATALAGTMALPPIREVARAVSNAQAISAPTAAATAIASAEAHPSMKRGAPAQARGANAALSRPAGAAVAAAPPEPIRRAMSKLAELRAARARAEIPLAVPAVTYHEFSCFSGVLPLDGVPPRAVWEPTGVGKPTRVAAEDEIARLVTLATAAAKVREGVRARAPVRARACTRPIC